MPCSFTFANTLSAFKSAMITLAVGKEGEEFFMHESLLSKNSSVFALATKKEWKEGQEHRVALPNYTSQVVNLYLQWLYSGHILSREFPEENYNPNGAEFGLLIDAFIFGEKMRDGNFKDAIIDAMIHSFATRDMQGVRFYSTPSRLNHAWQGTPAGSPLRKLLVDMTILYGNSAWLSGSENIEFLTELGKRLLDEKRMRTPQDPTSPISPMFNSCQYHHHHGKDTECYSRRGVKRKREQ